MTDILAVAFIVAAVGLALFYIIRQKKKGAKCIGCPYANECMTDKNNCSCSGKK